ncbi:MAG: hypothetical protein ACREJR_11590, partial [Candidatus Rokuibacteriota bacterium]
GQLIAFVGDSGDADGIASHLHFEVHPNRGGAVSPYRHLRRAHRLLYQRPEAGAYETMTVRIRGRVVWTVLDADPQRIRVKVIQVRQPNGWFVKPARNIVLSLRPEAVVRRMVAPGTSALVTLADFQPGDRVTVWTNEFPENLVSARAPWALHTVSDILLHLPK